jgi:riboflavin kinase/FMN adenylyltransferase
MRVYYDLGEVGKIKNSIVTTGIFDGVHTGHKAILTRLKKIAKEINGESVIITFHPHPRSVLYPKTKGKNLKLIYSRAEKIKLLQDLGIDHLIILPFTKEFASTTSQEFVKEILVKKLTAKKIVVGFNHHFGHMKTGNYEYLKKMGKESGFEVEEIPAQELENETISSTRIRNALIDGNIQRANAYLDHFYSIMGTLKKGDKNFSMVGFTMYKIISEDSNKLLPPCGIYAISAMSANIRTRGMLKICSCTDTPVKSKERFVEAHLFNLNNLNLSGQTLSVYLHKRIRKHLSFNSPEKLRAQLIKDKSKIEELIY